MSKGKLFLYISAFSYGVLPIFASIAYRGGVNGITLTFLRSFLSLPILLLVIKHENVSLRITIKQTKGIIKLSVFGCSLSILLLYLSYNYISTGLATTLHFVYPLIILVSSVFLYKERLTRTSLCSVIMATIGIFMFSDVGTGASRVGVILAILSGVFYSFYIIYIDYSGLDRINFFVLTFYTMLITSITVLIFGIIVKEISFSFMPSSWLFSVVISAITTLAAMPLLQIGTRYEGVNTAGIISTIEPITTIILGVVFLGERLGISQVFGGSLILFGVLLSQKKEKINH